MKKVLSMVLALCLVLSLCACSSKTEDTTDSTATDTTATSTAAEYKVAMITDYGDITDQSFNQTTYEACKAFCEANGVSFTYYKPTGDSTAERVAMVDKAVDDGYNVIVMPGYAFGGTIVETSEKYPDVKFIALDVAAGDILEAGVPAKGGTYDYNPSNWTVSVVIRYSPV